MMHSRCLQAALLVVALAAHAAGSAQSAGGPLASLPAQAKVTAEEMTLPGDEGMGLVGTSYLLHFGNGITAGPAAYGTISGRRGGLFVLGAEAAWQRRIAGPLVIDLGVFAGGGGGGAAPVGGGLLVRPHADLLWDFGPFLAGLSYARTRFANGDIDSKQLGLVWSAKTNFRYLPRERIGTPAPASGRSGIGFDRAQAVVGAYKPRSGSRLNSGGAHEATVGFVGMRMERAIGDHAYWGVEASGAGSGGVGGYAEYLGTVGAETAVWADVLTLGGRLALGMGGGGDVGVGGGLLVKAGAYTTWRLTRSLGLSLEAGLTQAPQGSFKALHAAASLAWILDDVQDVTGAPRTTRMEWVGGVESYDAQRRDGTRRRLQAVTMKVHRFVSPHVYLTGQAHSAYGGGAGAYSVGLIGIGMQAPLWGPVHAGAEALIGAAGGGGVDTEGGAIAQPMAYAGVALGPDVALRVGAGRIRALRSGGLDATVVELTLAFSFGSVERGPR